MNRKLEREKRTQHGYIAREFPFEADSENRLSLSLRNQEWEDTLDYHRRREVDGGANGAGVLMILVYMIIPRERKREGNVHSSC